MLSLRIVSLEAGAYRVTVAPPFTATCKYDSPFAREKSGAMDVIVEASRETKSDIKVMNRWSYPQNKNLMILGEMS